jgi:sulfoxide reductase heme-binding subunit YedZ
MTVEQRYRWLYKPAVFAAAAAPLALLVLAAAGLAGQSLGADPVKYVLHTLGKSALSLLLITLLITPLRQIPGWSQLLRLRRMLGLLAFSYAVLHFATYLALELQFDWRGLGKDIAKRPYITIGFAALLLLIPPAITSTNRMMRRLGRLWQRLHYLIYPAALLGVVHFYWQVKADVREPLIYAAILAGLLGYRAWTRWLRRRAVTSRSAPATTPGRT